MSSSSESLFYTLSKNIQYRIDKAFDVVSKDAGYRAFNADGDLMVTESVGRGGGSLSETTAGGGFIVEDDDEVSHTQIPLALIPAALQYLDLPPDDPEIRSIFRNAASGWSSSSLNIFDEGRNEEYVSRDDWRAVCAVLLEHDVEEDEGLSDSLPRDIPGPTDEDDDSDAYREPDSDSASSNGDVDEEFFEGASGSTSRREARGRRETGSSSLRFIRVVDPQKLTPHQRQGCLDAFALFFPDASSFELPEQKIMIKDIQRVAGLLKEKIKAEEMAEMLEMFSSSPEKSMNLMDFSRMMVTARLV